MKRIISILSVFAIAASFSLTSCVHKGDLELEPVPDIAFDYSSDGLTLTFTSVTPGTTNVSWEIVGQTTGSGESFTYTFPKPGNYWVQMKGTYGGREQSFGGKIMVAKPSPIDLHDGVFTDWDNVKYPDFMLEGSDGVTYGKIDYDANYVYFFIAMNTTLEKTGSDEAIMNIRMDADDLTGTGMSTKSLGCEWYLEGSFWEAGWYDMYDCASGNTEWVEKTIDVGSFKADDGSGMCYFEFGFPRKEYGINGSSISLFMKFYNADWNDSIQMSCQGKTTFKVAMDKME